MSSKLRKDIPMEIMIKALCLYHLEKYSANRIAKELGYSRTVLVKHMERKFNIEIMHRPQYRSSLGDILIQKLEDEEKAKKEREMLMEKLNKIARQYSEDMKVNVCEMGNKTKTRYDCLGVYKIKKKYDDYMLFVKDKNGIERKLSVAYRDILTKDVKVTLVG